MTDENRRRKIFLRLKQMASIERKRVRKRASAVAERYESIREIGSLQPPLAGEGVAAMQNPVVLEQQCVSGTQNHALGLERVE
jgi:hypothetical protein